MKKLIKERNSGTNKDVVSQLAAHGKNGRMLHIAWIGGRMCCTVFWKMMSELFVGEMLERRDEADKNNDI